MAGSPYIVTQGIVLRETQTKESDKILTLLTPERGKLSVIARGVRRKSCRYAACAQALVWSEWTLYHRGDWYYVNEGATLELFSGLREDLEAMALGFYFADGRGDRGGGSGSGTDPASAQWAVCDFYFTQATGSGKTGL